MILASSDDSDQYSRSLIIFCLPQQKYLHFQGRQLPYVPTLRNTGHLFKEGLFSHLQLTPFERAFSPREANRRFKSCFLILKGIAEEYGAPVPIQNDYNFNCIFS